MTMKLLEILDHTEKYGFFIIERVRNELAEHAKNNVFIDYERLEMDEEPATEFQESPNLADGIALQALKEGERSFYWGQTKATSDTEGCSQSGT